MGGEITIDYIDYLHILHHETATCWVGDKLGDSIKIVLNSRVITLSRRGLSRATYQMINMYTCSAIGHAEARVPEKD